MNEWKKAKVTATGVVQGVGKGNIYGGIVTQVVGTCADHQARFGYGAFRQRP